MSGNLKQNITLEKRKRNKMKVGDHIIEAAKKQVTIAENQVATFEVKEMELNAGEAQKEKR